jgi:chemotaxis response regulator CheB
LPIGLPAALVVMLNTGPGSILAHVLATRTKLSILPARSGALLQSGTVFVADAGSHVIVNPDAVLSVSGAPRRRCFRPSADWLFESAAASYGSRHIAVVLSGMMSDGSAALGMVKRLGGRVVAQAPEDAPFSDMPAAALSTGCVDRVVPVTAMAGTICELLAARNITLDRAAWERPFDLVTPT